MSSLPTLPVNIRHVAWQFARRAPLDAAQFLYGEIAQRMLQRLSYIRVSPDLLLDAGCGAGHAIEPLRARYPAAGYMGVDHCATLLDVARARHAGKRGLWNRLRNNPVPKTEFMCADMATIPLPPEQADLIWSNMALHWHDQPHAVLAEWRRLLRPDGVVMFSCLGPATFKELRSALQSAGLETATPAFVDMHDFGDLLIESGFADPVMDQEILTLTYRTPEKLLEDLRHLGGNPGRGAGACDGGRCRGAQRRARPAGQRGRAGDPHLHVHCSLPNVLVGRDGAVRTMADGGRELIINAPRFAAWGQEYVIAEAQSRGLLGEVWFNTETAQWEAGGFSKETLMAFSRGRLSVLAEEDHADDGQPLSPGPLSVCPGERDKRAHGARNRADVRRCPTHPALASGAGSG